MSDCVFLKVSQAYDVLYAYGLMILVKTSYILELELVMQHQLKEAEGITYKLRQASADRTDFCFFDSNKEKNNIAKLERCGLILLQNYSM
jgi:hypothetical protein